MHRTRLSLFYLAGYLLGAGVALIIAPRFSMQLLFSNRWEEYGNIIPRLVGVLLIVIGIIIVQIIRYRLEVLYATTLAVRTFIVASLIGLYLFSLDPFFLVLVAVVGFGIILTGTSYLLDRQSRSKSEPNAQSASS